MVRGNNGVLRLYTSDVQAAYKKCIELNAKILYEPEAIVGSKDHYQCFVLDFLYTSEYINAEVLGGLSYEIHLFGNIYYFARQSVDLLALIPIWLYRGKQDYHNKVLQYACYAFYPIHLLVLGIIKIVN